MTGSLRDPLFTPEEVAQRLGLHVRTVRRYIREGLLDAVKVGKRYRVPRQALEAFAGLSLQTQTTRHTHPVAEVSAVVGIDDLSRDIADRLTTLLVSSAQGRSPEDGALRVQTLYYPERNRLKVICSGDLAPVRSMLTHIGSLIEDLS